MGHKLDLEVSLKDIRRIGDTVWGIESPPSVPNARGVMQNPLDGLEVQVRLDWAPKNRPYNATISKVLSRHNKLTIYCYLTNIQDILHDHDVVLTNYEALSTQGAARPNSAVSLIRKISWHRIVLDECQEIKVPTNQIAKNCANLVTNHRWMVSGTPLCSRIDDLHGKLV